MCMVASKLLTNGSVNALHGNGCVLNNRRIVEARGFLCGLFRGYITRNQSSVVYPVMSPRRGSTPRLTDRLTVGRNATLTLSSLLSLVFMYNKVCLFSFNMVVIVIH
jgi:hypothetical protein